MSLQTLDTTTQTETPADTSHEEQPAVVSSAEAPFNFGGETDAVDEVIELELFHPDEEGPEPAPSRGTIPGTIAAVVLHVWLLATLHHLIVHEDYTHGIEAIQLRMPKEVKKEKKKEEKKHELVLVKPNDEDLPVQPVVNALSVGVVHNRNAKPLSPPDRLVMKINPDLKRQDVFDIPEGIEVSETVVVQGTTGNSLIQLESALDRVTHEIAMNLKEQKVLVVWLLDASASLQQQRDVISKRLSRIYSELDALKKAGQIPRLQEPLLTGVVSYGAATNFLTREPVVDFATIKAAVDSVQVDETGRENVFTAVAQTLKLWHSYRTSRRIMLITVTDESGDDFAMMQPAIRMCRRYGAKAYVIGPSAAFGRRQGYVPYIAPENGQTYQIPVDVGPETARYENLVMPFWFEGPQYEYVASGYGPYALSHLVQETGGIYFTTNTVTMKGLARSGKYEAEQIKPFVPDYRFGTPQEYDADLMKHPLRYAVVKAAQLSRDHKPESTPALELRVQPNNFRQTATSAQETVARSQLRVDTILEAFPKGIARQLDKEQSPRWRMNFCLTYGRLLAMRVRCLEYNAACADLKSNLTPEDVGSSANHWIFRPDDKINFATSELRNAKVARELLERVIDEAPGTPWALLAQRELQHPFGLRVVKRFIPPPTPRPRTRNNNTPPRRRILLAADPKKKQPRPKPRPKPKPVQPKLPHY